MKSKKRVLILCDPEFAEFIKAWSPAECAAALATLESWLPQLREKASPCKLPEFKLPPNICAN